jgi:hypothetical protein
VECVECVVCVIVCGFVYTCGICDMCVSISVFFIKGVFIDAMSHLLL